MPIIPRKGFVAFLGPLGRRRRHTLNTLWKLDYTFLFIRYS